MSVHEITQTPSNKNIGTVARSYHRQATRNPITAIVIYQDLEQRDIRVGIRVNHDTGRTPAAGSGPAIAKVIYSLPQATALEMAKGLLANIRRDYAATDEQLVALCREIVAAEERERKGINDVLDSRSV